MKLNKTLIAGACLLTLGLSACGEEKKQEASVQKETQTKTVAPKPAAPEPKAETPPAPKPVEVSLTTEERGKKAFKKCVSCHNIDGAKKHKVGPNLNGIIGRKAGTADGFKKYSADMVAYGEIWTADLVVEYLKDPSKFLKAKTGNKSAKSRMSFKLKKESTRKDVAAYLATLK